MLLGLVPCRRVYNSFVCWGRVRCELAGLVAGAVWTLHGLRVDRGKGGVPFFLFWLLLHDIFLSGVSQMAGFDVWIIVLYL